MRKILLFTTVILLVINTTGALFGGVMLMLRPDGSLLQMSADLLKSGPFENFLIPGMVLFASSGLLGIVVLFALLSARKNTGWLVAFQGLVLIVWILVQIMVIGRSFFLQDLFIGLGIMFILLGYLIYRTTPHAGNTH